MTDRHLDYLPVLKPATNRGSRYRKVTVVGLKAVMAAG